MSQFPDQDNQFEEFEENPTSPPPAAGRNRPFYIAVGVILLIFVIALIILLVTLFTQAPQQAAQTREQGFLISTQNAGTIAAATAEQVRAIQLQQTQTAVAKIILPTATLSPTATSAVTATPVLANPTATSTPTATVSSDMATRTSAAKTASALTPAAGAGTGTPGTGTPGAKTGTPGVGTPGAGTPGAGTPVSTPTIPKTGFADEVGLPGLLGLAALLVVVIFLARRARLAH
jgi:LPXTG-motif cell wall-anchored protein